MASRGNDALWRLGVSELRAGLQAGDFSSREITEACLERLEEVNPALNAITEVRAEAALQAADKADAAIRDGKTQGLLHGIPVTIKGNVDVAGWATVHGCQALTGNIARENSDCVQNWLNAGAIILGRTNTPEFCCRWETTNEVFGITHNPWNADLTPGGSSGGAAASLACGITPLAHGTDLGGSLRDPAQACGVASIKPTLGRVPDWVPSDPADPAIGVQMFNTDGPMARRVADVRIGLQAMSAQNWHDPWWVPAPLELSNAPRRVALVTNPGQQGIHGQVAEGIERAGKLLEKAGYEVVEIEPPGLEEACEAWKSICIGELTSLLAPAVADICGERLSKCLANYQAMAVKHSFASYNAAFSQRKKLLRQWKEFFTDYPLIVAPVCTHPPMPCDEDIESLEKAREVVHKHRVTVAINALGLPAAVVPVGIAENLPQVVQIIGPAFQEMDCLAAAEAIEQQVKPLTPIDPR